MKKLIVHVAETDISNESGMGRVAWHWKNEFEKRGYDFCHIGLKEVGTISHPSLFPFLAYRAYQRLERYASLFLVHEPASGFFINSNIPTIVVSHGLERRGWEQILNKNYDGHQNIKLRTKFLFPLWRLSICDIGLRKSTALLLINQEDRTFAQKYYLRNENDIHIFKNGVYASELNEALQPNTQPTILFIGSWIERKGIATIIKAAEILQEKGCQLKWIMAGTGLNQEIVLNSWKNQIKSSVKVIPSFSLIDEESIFANSNIFVLPSIFEGQPLALLQAMECGRCCITTNCCGQKDLIHHGYNGFLHELGNAQQMAFLIQRCLENEELRKTVGRNAKNSVKNRKWETVCSEIVDQIEKWCYGIKEENHAHLVY